MTAEERWARLVETMLARPDTTYGSAGAGPQRAFGSTSLKTAGKIFAMLVKDRLVVKLDRRRVDALVTAGEGERFDPGHGRVMKEWLAVEFDVRGCLALVGDRGGGIRRRAWRLATGRLSDPVSPRASGAGPASTPGRPPRSSARWPSARTAGRQPSRTLR